MAIFDRNLGCRPLKPPVFPGLLVDRAKARKGQSMLIHAGSGGLGSFAIQYAKHELGLHVTTTTSSRNAHWVRELGADVIVAYDRENYASLPARYDIVCHANQYRARKPGFHRASDSGGLRRRLFTN